MGRWSPPYIYTHYTEDNHAPGNPGWGPLHYYDTLPTVYTISYYNPSCGEMPSNSYNSAGATCFVSIGGGSYSQGNLVTFVTTGITPCEDLPIDDYIPYIFLTLVIIGIYYLRRKQLTI